MFALVLILFGLPLFVTVINFISYLIKGNSFFHISIQRIIEVGAFIILPTMYMTLVTENDCCDDSTPFSPDHVLTIWVVSIFAIIAYFYTSYRKTIATPVIEVLINSLLLFGIVFNIFIAIQTKEAVYALLGNLPIILLEILALAKNQKAFIDQTPVLDNKDKRKLDHFAWKILSLKPIAKFPIIFIFCLPILLIISSILLLFGQKPDSIISAFTETYKHGFSQWDYKCANVECGEHYLCSVAANGHSKIVKPQRGGVRNGQNIICNRQLLISNAFEDLLKDKLPFLHKPIRQHYNKIGNLIHRYYGVFNNKFVSDLIYFIMKPLEWFFLITLYTFDKKPENRIEKQYISNKDRLLLETYLSLLH